MGFMLSTDSLTKKYRSFTVVDSVSIQVEEGAVFGIIGENGAGKTTLLRMLGGSVLPTSGTISLDPSADGKKGHPIGYMDQYQGIFLNLSAKDNLEIRRRSIGSKDTGEAERLLEFVGLRQWVGVRASSFAPGLLRRLGIALALVGDPKLLLLDEPLSGIDSQDLKDVSLLLMKLSREQHRTIVLTASSMANLSGIVTHCATMENGRIGGSSTEQEYEDNLPGYICFIVDPLNVAKEVLNDMGVYSYQTKSDHMLHVLEQLGRKDEMVRRMEEAGAHVTRCQVLHDMPDADSGKEGWRRG